MILIGKRRFIKKELKNMALKIFFDVNVLLDFFLERSPSQQQINFVFDALDENKISGFVSISVIQTCTFYLKQAKGIEVSKDIIRLILQKFSLIDGEYDDVLNAINSSQPDLEDSIHYFMALRNHMDAILTSDKDFLKLSKVFLPILSPVELAASINFK
jgi:predicted nucleic acid-binding protein